MKQDKRCLDYQKAIRESESELQRQERHQSKALLRDRVRFLRLLKSGECGSQGQAGNRIGLKLRASERLWSKYCQGGLQALLTYPYQGTQGKLSEEQKQQLQEELSHDNYQTAQQVCTFVNQQFGIFYTPSGMLYVFKCLRIKKKTGRPEHDHKDHKGERQFKKKLYPP
jgi:transposase